VQWGKKSEDRQSDKGRANGPKGSLDFEKIGNEGRKPVSKGWTGLPLGEGGVQIEKRGVEGLKGCDKMVK